MDPQEPEKTSNVFQTLLMMFRNLNGDDIRDHISTIRKYYGPLFGHKTPFVKELLLILKAVSRKDSISESMILGISSLLFESIRGVSGQARRNGLEIYKALIDVLVGKKPLNKASTLPSQSLVDILYELQYCLAEFVLNVEISPL